MKHKFGLILMTLSLLPAVSVHNVVKNSSQTAAVDQDAPAAEPIAAILQRRAPARVVPVRPSIPALAAVEAETDPVRRGEALDRAVEAVPRQNQLATLNALVHADGAAAAELSQLLTRRWAERDPAGAAAWAAQLQGPANIPLLEQVAVAWAENDLVAASAWLNTLPEGDSRAAATIAVAYEAARTDPLSALDLAAALPSTRARDDLLVHGISQWAAADSAAASEWSAKVPDLILRERLLAATAVASAERDGAGAAAMAAETLQGGGDQDRAVVAIVQRWTEQSPASAAGWVAQFPDAPLRSAALEQLLSLWTGQDAGAARNWLTTLPAGSLQNSGLLLFSQIAHTR